MISFNWLVQSWPFRKTCRGVQISVSSFNLSTLWCVDLSNPAASQASGNFAGDAVARQTNTCFPLQTNKSDRKKLIKPDQGIHGERTKNKYSPLIYVETVGDCRCSVGTNNIIIFAMAKLHGLNNVAITHGHRLYYNFLDCAHNLRWKCHLSALFKILHDISYGQCIAVSCKIQHPFNIVRRLSFFFKENFNNQMC